MAPHRACAEQGGHRPGVNFAVVVVGALKIDDHVLLALVVADSFYQAATSHGFAYKWGEIQATAILNVYHFCIRSLRRRQQNEPENWSRFNSSAHAQQRITLAFVSCIPISTSTLGRRSRRDSRQWAVYTYVDEVGWVAPVAAVARVGPLLLAMALRPAQVYFGTQRDT